MGRGMVIMALGSIIVLGLIQLGMNQQRNNLQTLTSDYAKEIQSKNVSNSAIQLAMEKINKTPGWTPNSGSPWQSEIDGAYIELYYEQLSTGASITDPDSIRIYSTAWYGGTGTKGSSDYKASSSSHTIISTYLKLGLHFIPETKGSIGFGSGNFNFNMSGSATINGNDASGNCPDLPGITVNSLTSYNEVITGAGTKITDISSSVSPVAIDPDLSYEPVDQLIARLNNEPGVVSISGNYNGSLGTEDAPGVFFVDSYAKLAGGTETGYGILVIRSGGELELEGGLSISGNFNWNGLMIFENAFDFKGTGTPSINGGVLIGNTPGNNTVLDVDINGNLDIQYDCDALNYAKIAASTHLKQNRYIRVSTFE